VRSSTQRTRASKARRRGSPAAASVKSSWGHAEAAAEQRRGDRVGAAERRVVPGGGPCLGLGWLGDRAQDGVGDAQLDRCDVGRGEPLGAQPQGGVHPRVGEVVARVRLEDPPSVTIGASATSAITLLTVLAQAADFTSQLVTLTASYAGRTLTSNVRVVSPDTVGLPHLEIVVDRSADPCRPVFVEGAEQIFTVTNLFVFADQTGLTSAGTEVTVRVTVTNAQGLHAAGTLTFETVALDFHLID
jgi:hypothetical protein